MRITGSILSLFIILVILSTSVASPAQIGVSITIGPPALPVYEQPPCPAPAYMWTPGYWAYDYNTGEYYWVPGTWVPAPQPSFLWTPPYWGWNGVGFIFYEGYWGPHVGFYGGIPYGFGYSGEGYEGGRWENGEFYYNRSVNNVNVTNIHNVYNTTVINNNTTINRVSYNGGNGGTNARPTREQEAAAHERHIAPVAAQTQHVEAARANPQLRASVNQGKPPIAATPTPGAFHDRSVVPAKEAGAPYQHGANRAEGRQTAGRPENNVPRPPGGQSNGNERPANNVPRPPVHANDLATHERPAPPNTGNPKLDQKYQRQQDKLYSKMEQEHQKLQQKQAQEHQRMEQRNADDARTQQMEQRHQQQTQQMEQKHAQQMQKLQQRQQPKEPRPRR